MTAVPKDLVADLTAYLADPTPDVALVVRHSGAPRGRKAADAARAGSPDPERDARLGRARWLVEELRVSLFAQQLGTAEPVSAKRIRALL